MLYCSMVTCRYMEALPPTMLSTAPRPRFGVTITCSGFSRFSATTSFRVAISRSACGIGGKPFRS